MLTRKSGLAFLVAALCFGVSSVHAQVAPLSYWVPGGPFGLGGAQASGFEYYGNFPGFDASGTRDSGFFSRRYGFTSNWANSGGLGFGTGLGTGLGAGFASPYGSLAAVSVAGSDFGYKFKSGVSVYGGFDTLKVGSDLGSPFAAFSSTSSTIPVSRVRGGVEFQPTANTSLSLGFSYTQQNFDRLDSDINSPALAGETPAAFTSGRR